MRFPTLSVLALALAFSSCSAAVSSGPAPAWKLADVKGKSVQLVDYQGKVVLINFWATWCPPCKAEIPELISLQSHYRGKGLTVLGLSVDSLAPSAVADFAKQIGINYPVIMANEKTAEDYGADQGIPLSVLVDQTGVVRWSHLGFIDPDTATQLRKTVDGLLATAPAGK